MVDDLNTCLQKFKVFHNKVFFLMKKEEIMAIRQ